MTLVRYFGDRVVAFYTLMVARLAKNEHRKDWNDYPIRSLTENATSALESLESRIVMNQSRFLEMLGEAMSDPTANHPKMEAQRRAIMEDLSDQCADVANWAFILEDWLRNHEEELFPMAPLDREAQRRDAERD